MLCSVGFLHQKWPIWKKKKSAEIAILHKKADLKLREERQNCLSVKIKNMRIRNFETRNSTFISAIETLGCRARTLCQQSFAVFYFR